MAGSDSAYPKETTLNYVSVASHSVSFAVKIKSKRGKEMSSPFLSAFAFFFLYYCILLCAIRPIPSSNTRLSQCPLCNEGFNPFPLILLQSLERFQAEQQRHREEEEETLPSKRKKITCGVQQRIELKTKVKRWAHQTSGLSIRSFLEASVAQAKLF